MAIMEFPDYMKLYKKECEYNATLKAAVEHYRVALRDQFAMAALQGMVCCADPSREECEELSAAAYALADAMLEARKEVKGE